MAAFVSSGSVWLKVAAASGVSAVALGGYGTHMLHPEDPKYTTIFGVANTYHMTHSLLIAAAPLARFAPWRDVGILPL